jgi:tRNA pseudouridine38-40 synthase
MRNIKLILEYDGTRYCGWQKQPQQNVPTVQGELDSALRRLLGESIDTVTAGRTDTGVHAYGQVVNFFTESDMKLSRIPYSLNAILPDDIVIKSGEEVSAEFDARHDPLWREYHYYILNRPYGSVFLDRFVVRKAKPLDIGKMDMAVKYLEGRHDFTSFCTVPRGSAKNNGIDNPVRKVLEISCSRDPEIVWVGEPVEGLITIKIRAHAFLHNMVRIIVGTAMEVGLGRRDPEGFKSILDAKDRSKAGMTAPAKGLTLVKVQY